MKITLDPTTTPFSLEHTLQCGQVFRWKKLGEWWYGVVAGKAIKVRQIYDELEFEGVNADFVKKYFRLTDPLPSILSKLSKDEYIKTAIQNFHGLRLIQQDPWECLISYICATYKNIPAIKKTISNLAKQFGDKTTLDGYTFYTFPKPSSLASTSVEALKGCKLGFRAKSVLETAKRVDSQAVRFSELERMNYEDAKNELLKLPGVGDKVADCVLLFSLNKLEAFPLDVWMKKTILNHYYTYFDDVFTRRVLRKKSLTPSEYRRISSFARQYFGEYAGYAQQYLFHHERSICEAV
jgi:N-glycosylase/DNA lyase